ncbi:MAG: hypothetical protein ABFD79_18480 [Phycisphaerales bacterium]
MDFLNRLNQVTQSQPFQDALSQYAQSQTLPVVDDLTWQILAQDPQNFSRNFLNNRQQERENTIQDRLLAQDQQRKDALRQLARGIKGANIQGINPSAQPILDTFAEYGTMTGDVDPLLKVLQQQAEANAPSRPTALMQNYEFIRTLMPNADPVSVLPFASGTGLSGGVNYDPTTGEVTKPSKPLPTTALKIQNDAIADLATAEGTQQNLDKFINQIDQGKLDFGLISNAINKARNNLGISTEESANLSSFQSSLEKLRNDSLRLNAGVQTDGDAQRAWNELFQNINDPDLVRQRLEEIKQINARGADLKRLQIDTLRNEYGKDPYDFSQVSNIAPLNAQVPSAQSGTLTLDQFLAE